MLETETIPGIVEIIPPTGPLLIMAAAPILLRLTTAIADTPLPAPTILPRVLTPGLLAAPLLPIIRLLTIPHLTTRRPIARVAVVEAPMVEAEAVTAEAAVITNSFF
jgi:hypothetical protein